MKKHLITLLLIASVHTLMAQSIAGNWYGNLKVQGQALPIVFHITQTGNTYTTKWDSPSQGANNLDTKATTLKNNIIQIDASQYGIVYTGNFLPDSNKINGTFSQGGLSMPLVLTPNKQEAAAQKSDRRPQDPSSFPYKQEEVTFINPKGGNKLAGTLTLPANGKASKIVVLISGSGAQNRNEELMNHRPFLVWSDWLTRQGIAVLRYDDRGVNQSTGNFQTATTADFADDAEAAVNFIKSREDLKALQVGLIGHSEGGMVAPMVASRNKQVNFLVLLAAPGVPIDQLLIKQSADLLHARGVKDSIINLDKGVKQTIYKAVKQYNNLPAATFKGKLDTITVTYLRKIDPQPVSDSIAYKVARKQYTDELATPWYRYFITFNPAQYLTQVKCPVLALNGTLDLQVDAGANLPGIKTSLQKAGNKKFETVPLPGLNHLFQKATTGDVSEYAKIEETVNPAALQKVSSWINGL
ncbi:alpha/beta hydrolase [Mucilaginibacter sp. Bleaf8]|uniref:alpha/beta hydrolase family protein n=1 Tax=Mucilaginibacter sp. Bleaf8 TaxID=2834430 RepID=UPI001BD1AD03|nr:alpha/beta hydrolase [Mucilaginibacter sp. Bleaf8]MBS7566364.1 alpha/beta hydrolase [Mucilaginibacter sp. Bleaf8]